MTVKNFWGFAGGGFCTISALFQKPAIHRPSTDEQRDSARRSGKRSAQKTSADSLFANRQRRLMNYMQSIQYVTKNASLDSQLSCPTLSSGSYCALQKPVNPCRPGCCPPKDSTNQFVSGRYRGRNQVGSAARKIRGVLRSMI